MHSIESLRQIRAMESVLGPGNENLGRDYRAPPRRVYGEPFAVARYDLATGELEIELLERDRAKV